MMLDFTIVAYVVAYFFTLLGILILSKKIDLLTNNGIIVAGLISVVIFAAHPVFFIILMIFFFIGSFLSKYKATKKKPLDSIFEKSSTRDEWQVLANGGVMFLVSAIIIVARLLFVQQVLQVENELLELLEIGAVTSIAATTSDTVATEIGILHGKRVRFVLNPFKIVPRGTSGGVSKEGTLAALMGSSVIAVSYLLIEHVIN